MKSSTHLIWLRRLIILGAVVAGTVASAAGAAVSRPPDVRDAAATANLAVPDVLERYATAHPYGSGLSSGSQPTPVDRIIAQERGRQADLGLFSLGLSAPTSSTLVSRPPDVSDAAQAAESVSFTQSSGFDWGDYAIGIGSGIGLTLILAAGLAVSWQRRHRMQTV